MKKKYVQFVAIFHLLGKGRPMINFEVQINRLVYFARDQMHSKKTLDWFFWLIHGEKWSEHDVFIALFKETMTFINLIIVSANEVNMVDNS